jgi:hypothetical protein
MKYIDMTGILILVNEVRHSSAGLIFADLHHAWGKTHSEDKQIARPDQGVQKHLHILQKGFGCTDRTSQHSGFVSALPIHDKGI